MTIDINAMGEDEWRKLLVPDHDGMARVGGVLIDQAKLNLTGLLDAYNTSVRDATLFALLVGLAETCVQQMHLRDDPDALEALKNDVANHMLRRRLVAMKKHSIAAQRLLDELDAELAANGAAAGRSLGWSASERQIISMAADAIDRGVELAAAYAEAVDVKDKIKVSREIRLKEMATTRLLSKVSTAVPAPESLRSIKARNAVNKRWHPDAG